jgi:hypothetical protein
MLWPAIVAALLPLELAEVVTRLPRLVARLARLGADRGARALDDRSHPRQLDEFRSRYASQLAGAA